MIWRNNGYSRNKRGTKKLTGRRSVYRVKKGIRCSKTNSTKKKRLGNNGKMEKCNKKVAGWMTCDKRSTGRSKNWAATSEP